jgi:hypothetical protein
MKNIERQLQRETEMRIAAENKVSKKSASISVSYVFNHVIGPVSRPIQDADKNQDRHRRFKLYILRRTANFDYTM